MRIQFRSLANRQPPVHLRKTGLILAMALLAPLASLTVTTSRAAPTDVRADRFLVVDCLIPGQVRRLGSRMTYLTPRRPIRTTAGDCEIRGGEYVQFDRANYATALKVWLPAAKKGDPKAQTYVGEIFEKGLGTTTDDHAAAVWYRKAADQGFSRAMLNLGYLYEKGLGVEQSMSEALNWYRRASGLDGDLEFASSIQVTLAEKDRRIATLRQQSTASRREVEALRSQLKETKRGLARQEQELQATRRKLEDIRRQLQGPGGAARGTSEPELQKQRQQLSHGEQRLAAKSTELEALEKKLREQASSLTAEQRQAAKENTGLQKRLIQQEAETQRLQRRFAMVNQELNDARALLKNQQEAQDANQVALLNATEKDRRALEAELGAKQQETLTLRKDLRMAERGLDASGAKYAQAASDLERRQSLYEAEKRQLAAERDQLSADVASLSEQTEKDVARIDRLQTQLKAQETKYADKLKGLEQRYAESRKHLESSQARLALLKKEPATGQVVAAAPPTIELIEPPVTLMRGAYAASVARDIEQREVIGRVKAPAGLMRFNVNDHPTQVDGEGLFRTQIAINQPRQPVSLVAVDKQGRRVSFTFDLFRKRQDTTASVSEAEKKQKLHIKGIGTYYALIIGNNDYAHLPDLRTPLNDAKEIEKTLKNRYGYKTKLIANADRYTILSALNELRGKLTEKDNLLIYYAGHGEIDDVNQQGYWLPVDAEQTSTANWISTRDISDILNAMTAKHVMVVADSCYSGAMTRSALARLQSGKSADQWERWFEKMAGQRTRVVLTSGGVEPVSDSDGGDHSVFARAFIQALRENDRCLDGYNLFIRVSKYVRARTKGKAFEQTPQYAPIKFAGHEAGEFLFQPI